MTLGRDFLVRDEHGVPALAGLGLSMTFCQRSRLKAELQTVCKCREFSIVLISSGAKHLCFIAMRFIAEQSEIRFTQDDIVRGLCVSLSPVPTVLLLARR